MKRYVIFIIVLVFILQGCSPKEDKSDMTAAPDITAIVTEAGEITPTVSSKSEDQNSDSAEASKEVAATEIPLPSLVLPTIENNTCKTLIQTVSASTSYRTTSFIITSSKGEMVVVDPTQMPGKSIIDINPAAILSTHSHPDHTDARFVKEYPDAQTILYNEGELETEDFHIYSIKATHNGDTINGTDYIMVFEVDDLRIAHMGDIGQTSLTKEQLEALGEIDIAFMQFDNSYSSMNVKNLKGFLLIEQLNPKIIIPTHYSNYCLPIFDERYGATKEIENILEISKDELPDGNLNLYLMSNTHKYK